MLPLLFDRIFRFSYDMAIKAGVLDSSSKSAVNLVMQFSITIAMCGSDTVP